MSKPVTTIKNYIKLDKQIIDAQAIADTKDSVEYWSDKWYEARDAKYKVEKLQAKIEKLNDTLNEMEITETEWYELVSKAMEMLKLDASNYALENVDYDNWN
jgi:hypothetical protein